MGYYTKSAYPQAKVPQGVIVYLRQPGQTELPTEGTVRVLWRTETLKHRYATIPVSIIGKYSGTADSEDW
jgi:hypothetical protein